MYCYLVGCSLFPLSLDQAKSISSLDLSSLNYCVLGMAAAVPQDPGVNKPRPTAWCRFINKLLYFNETSHCVAQSCSVKYKVLRRTSRRLSRGSTAGMWPFCPFSFLPSEPQTSDLKPWVSSWTMKGLWRHVLGWWDRKTEWVGKALRTVVAPNPDYKCLPSGLLRLEKLLSLI